MKKSKKLLLAMLVAGSMAVLTACGMKEPTEDDVMEALIDEEIIDEDEEDNYTVTIDKVSLDEEDEEAKVTCLVVSKEGSMEVTNKYKIRFKYRDDKSWRPKEVELKDTETKLVAGIEDEEAAELVEDMYLSVDGTGVSMDDEDVTFKAGKHENDLENMQDTVTFECTASSGYYELAFNLEVVFQFYSYDTDGYWSYIDYSVTDVETEYAENYTLEPTAEEVAEALAENDEKFYAMSEKYLYASEGAEITDFTAEEAEISEYYAYVPVTFTYKYEETSIKLSASLVYYYYESDGWVFDYVDDYELLDFHCGLTGTYSGKSGDNTVTIKFLDTYNAEKYGMDAEVSVTTAEGVSYSYKAYVTSWAPSDENEFAITAGDWIVEPADGYYYTSSYYGNLKDGSLVSNSSWNPWTFTKQQ